MKQDDDLAARVAALEKDNAALRARVTEIESAQPSPTKQKNVVRREDEGPRVVTLLEEQNTFPMPNGDELRRLFSRVRHRVPNRLDIDEEKLFSGFCAAFRRIASLGRRAEPNSKYALSWWVDDCQAWTRARNIPGDVGGAAFILAVLAAGDVGHVPANSSAGIVWEFALEPYGGKPGIDAWRRVLASGAVLAASVPQQRPSWDTRMKVGAAW